MDIRGAFYYSYQSLACCKFNNGDVNLQIVTHMYV